MSPTLRRVAAVALLIFALYRLLASAASLQDWLLWHPVAMCIAFLGIMPEIVALGSRARAATSKTEKEAIVETHALLGFVCKITALIGHAAIYMYKADRGYPHLTTLHGQLGAASTAALLLQVVLGALQNPQFAFISPVARQRIRQAHALCSYVLLACVTAAMFLGWTGTRYAAVVFPDDEYTWARYAMAAAVPVAVTLAALRG